MSANKDQKNNATVDREIVFSRLFEAPRAMVWDAWTDPVQLVQWWGPKGFTTSVQEYDLRTGGTWKLIMHGPDGTDYPNKSIFTEVIPYKRLSYKLSGGKQGGPVAQFEMTATFEDEAGKTRLTMRLVFPTAEARDQNVRPGGKWRGCLHRDPDPGTDQPTLDLWQEGQYLEVVPPERLIFTFRWDNRDGQPTPATTVTITFEEHNGKTTMHFHQAFFKTMEDRDGHCGGWNSSFDRLDDHLAATTSKEHHHV